MAGRGALFTFGAFLLASFAGCVGETGSAFETVPTPEWAAGYTWAYTVGITESETAFEDGSRRTDARTHELDLAIEVVNTTQPLAGESVYYIQLSQRVDHPLFEGSVQALRQSDLSLAGLGYDGYHMAPMVAPPRVEYATDDVAYSGSVPYEYYDPCQGRPSIEPVDADEAGIPAPTFPLEPGQRRTGSWGEPGDFAFSYKYKVIGQESVTVPAGTFDAVHVSVNMVPRMDDFVQFVVSIDYWYAPAAQYFVKTVTTASAVNPGFDRNPDFNREYQFRYEAVQELTSFQLVPTAEQEAPAERSDEPYTYEYVERRIVADTEFPVNTADGPMNVTFGLEALGRGKTAEPHDRHSVAYTPSIPYGTIDPDADEVDNATHRIQWILRDPYGYGAQRVIGDTATFAVPMGGPHWVEAIIQPLECGGSWPGSYGGQATTYWERDFRFNRDELGTVSGPVDVFPVAFGANDGWVTWTGSHPTAASGLVSVSEPGHARVVDPGGNDVSNMVASDRTEFWPYEPGKYQLEWVSDLPVTTGEDVKFTLRVNYYWDGQVGY